MGKGKSDEPTTAKTTKVHKYTAKEKREYQTKNKGEKVEKGKTARRPKIMRRVWANAHAGIDQKLVDERTAKGEFT